jgi:hypothetical protein
MFVEGAEDDSRRSRLTLEELERVLRQYPGAKGMVGVRTPGKL